MAIPALPTLQRDLNTTTTWVTWVLTMLLLVASLSTPILANLADPYPKRRLLVVSLVLFFVGCAGAAAAWNIWALIFFRAFQGIGAAVFPLSFGIIRDEFPREKVGVGIGLISAVFGVGGGFGIVFSGLIVDNLSWRWVFVFGAIPVPVARRLAAPAVAGHVRLAGGCPGRAPALCRARVPAARADRRRELGLDLRRGPRALRERGGLSGGLGGRRAARSGAAGRHAGLRPATSAVH